LSAIYKIKLKISKKVLPTTAVSRNGKVRDLFENGRVLI